MTSGLLIFLGGGLGALSRWLLSGSVQMLVEKTPLHRFPWGIATCNLLGCFAIGIAFGIFTTRTAPTWFFPLLITGFLGGFTTFSAFSHDTRELIFEGFRGLALANVLVSTLGGILLVFLGFRAGHSLAS